MNDGDKIDLPDDELNLEPHENLPEDLPQDLSLDAPDLEPSKAESGAPKSQALKDLERFEEAGGAVPEPEAGRGDPGKPGAKKPAQAGVPRGYHWFFVHLLALLGLIVWAAGCFLEGQPYKIEAGLIALIVVLATVPTMRTFHVRTRAGLAGLGAALGLAVSSLYNPDGDFWPGIPLALVWVFVLLVVWVWLVAAVLRHEEMRRNKSSLVLSALLLYPVLAPVWGILVHLTVKGLPLDAFGLRELNHSPEFLTNGLPWFFWPQAFLAFLVPPLAALFLLKDQLATSKKGEKTQRHLGALWLSLAGFVVLVYSLMSFGQAAEDFPRAVGAVRGLLPAASEYHAALSPSLSTAVPSHTTPPPAIHLPKPPRTEPAGGTDADAADLTAPEGAPPADGTSADAAGAGPASEETLTAEGAAPSDGTTAPEDSTTAAAETAETSETPPPHTVEVTADSSLATAAETAAPETAAAETATAEAATPETATAEAGTDEAATAEADAAATFAAAMPGETPLPAELFPPEETGPVRVTSLEIGHNGNTADFAPSEPAEQEVSTLLVHTPESGPPNGTYNPRDLTPEERVVALTLENAELKTKILVLEAQHDLLTDRIKHQDMVILNLSTP
ncbi:MAG: hypothetical protein LBP95_07445 [Deltaproteobacteria bacterium]|jgi:hypothetical protein|nr:hypothetical protein [Deltaproteobacteria bacterium]